MKSDFTTTYGNRMQCGFSWEIVQEGWIDMNYRKLIREKIKILKEEFGCYSIKAEFEAEGSRKDELIMLREFVETADLGLIIKIGGCEAMHDIDQCKLLGATGIMAPMIETPFAVTKFKGAVTKLFGNKPEVECIINAETRTCLANFDEILSAGEGFLTGVTVGRSDLSASMGIPRSEIETEPIFNATKEFCEKARSHGLTTNFGGNIGLETIPFILQMEPVIDRFETRKVVLLKSNDALFLEKAVKCALEFELLYLRFKSEYYRSMAEEDAARIVRLEKQLK